MGLATLASTRPSAQTIPISDALATLSKGVGDIGIDVATSPVHPYWQRIGDIVNRGGHQPSPLPLATHWQHRQRGWRHCHRRSHQLSPFLLATHWRRRQQWRPPARSIAIGDALATSSTGLATLASTRPSAQSIPIGDALATSSTGLATLASTHPPAQSIAIGDIVNGVGDIGVDAAISPVHSYERRIGDIVNRAGDIGIDGATSPFHSYWQRIGNNGNGWQDWWPPLYEIYYFVEVTMKGVPLVKDGFSSVSGVIRSGIQALVFSLDYAHCQKALWFVLTFLAIFLLHYLLAFSS